MNVLPWPTRDCTVISPPWASTIRRQNANPTPEPEPEPAGRSWVFLVVKNGRKMFFRFSTVMPLPVLDENFMNSHEARWLRILAETTYAQVQMKQLGVHNTIVFFGSAQIPPPEEAEAGLNEARRQGDATEIARAEKIVEISRYYDQARELAARLTRWAMDQGTDDRRRFNRIIA